ncbi:MAG TPA: class I adenylate-forming enzyme family protein [Acidimicrobiia bacterium]|nr:class I adenylate-forming enzyme family protein [Acidimicrobiia bacterium]
MLAATLREAARRFSDQPAVVTEAGWSLTYRDLDRLSDEVGAGLRARGVDVGDVVALVLPPGPEYLIAYLGAAKVGAITAGVNDRLTTAEREAVLARATPRLVLAAPGFVARDVDTVELAPAPDAATLHAPLRRAGEVPATLPEDPDRPVAIVFTSGTTGTPKGALYGNRQLACITATDVGDAWGGGGRSFTGTSFAHLGFMTKLPGNLRRGGTSFILTRWSARAALELLAEQRMTSVGGVPAQLALMLRQPDFDSYDLESVRFIVAGGGPITPGLAEEARARFHALLATRYSCTEAGIGLGTAFDDPEEDAVVSVGRPHAAVELRVLDGDDRAVPDGEVGAVCLRSPAVMSAYWRDPDGTAAAFTADGFVRTGDLGWLDDRGRLRLVGRTKEMYVRGGYNVYPVEVEACLSTHPAVAAVAVVPRHDPVMGEVGVAVVVPADPGRAPTLEALRAHGAERLARYKLPEDVRVVDALPLTSMDKVDRRALARDVAVTPTEGPGPP